jgi:hypothetical protein
MHKSGPSSQNHTALYWSSSDAPGSGGNNSKPEEGSNPASLTQKLLSTIEYRTVKLDDIQPEEIEEVFQAFTHRLVAAQEKSDKRLKLNYFYKIKLANSLNLPEIFGRLTYFYPKDVDIEKVEKLNLLVPQMKGKPVKVMLQGDWLKDRKNVESSRLRVPFFLDKSEENTVKNASLIQYNGFEPVLYDQADPTQISKNAISWVNVISGTWVKSIKDEEKKKKTLEHFKVLMESDNHIIINYRSPGNDLDLNRNFNIVPVQWAKRSFFDAFEEKHIMDIVVNGYNNFLQNRSVMELLA